MTHFYILVNILCYAFSVHIIIRYIVFSERYLKKSLLKFEKQILSILI